MKKLKLSLICTFAALLCCALFAFVGVHIYNDAQNTISATTATEEIFAPEHSATATANTTIPVPTFDDGSTNHHETYDGGDAVNVSGLKNINSTQMTWTATEGIDTAPLIGLHYFHLNAGYALGQTTHTITFTAKSGYVFTGGKSTSKLTLVIDPMYIDRPSFSDGSFSCNAEYTGGAVSVTGLKNVDASKMTYTGSTGVDTAPVQGLGYFYIGSGATVGSSHTITFNIKKNTKNTYDYIFPNGSTSLRLTVSIVARDISKATIGSISTYTYDGTEKKPQPSVTLGSYSLTYEYSYSSNVDAGTATVKVSGTGNFTGSVSKTFTINRATVSVPTLSESSTTFSLSSQTITISSISGLKGTLPTNWSGDDTTITIPANASVGSYSISVTPDSNHCWSDKTYAAKSLSFTINKLNFTNNTAITSSKISDYTYDGNAKTPTPTISYNDTALTKDTHYTLSYNRNTNASTSTDKAQVIVTGKGNCEGSKTFDFTINKGNITPTLTYTTVTGNITNYNSVTYGTKSGTPEVGGNKGSGDVTYSIKNGTGAATIATDGILTPTKVGTVKVKVTIGASDNYNGGEKEITVTIYARDLANVNIDPVTKTYTGSAIEPALTVKDTINGSNTASLLVKDTDYTVVFTNNINVGSKATATLTGKGNYTGTQTFYFTIEQRSITNVTIDPSPIPACTYDGSPQTPTPTVKDGNTVLVEGTDFEYKYENNIEVGTAKLILKGLGNYNDEKQISFSIDPPSMKDATVTLSQTVFTYDGTAKEPTVTSVSVAGLTLTEGTDFTVGYSANVKAGTAKVILTGKGTYAGTKEVEFTINPADISTAVITGLQLQYVFTGSDIEPNITVTLDGKDLVENTDYLVTYTDNLNVGPATLTVTGSKNYTGTLTDNFTIVKASISTATVTGINTTYEYTGSAINPVPVVTWNGIVLVKETDYTVTYGTNTALGDGTVTITGCGNLNGTINKTFTITPADISTAQISGIDANYTYTGTAITPSPTVTLGTTTLSSDDYTVTYTNNTAVGTATVTVTGKGNYTGTVGTTFVIDEADLSDATVEGVDAEYEYTGTAITPDPVVKLGTATLVKDTDYTVSYTNNINVGTATITITGIGNYELTVTATFGITAKDITDATIEGHDESYTYTGTAIQPAVTVKLDGVTLTLTTEYTVAYTDNTNVGTATITATGTGNYTGEASVTFEITGADITNASLEGVNASYPYTGSDIEPNVTVKLDGAALTLTTDYTVTYSDNLEVGTATITVTGTGNYTGSASTTFEITKVKPTVTVTFTDYDGTSVRYAGTAIPDIEYTATFGGNAITGTLSWTGDILVSGVNDYGWEFVPENENLEKVTGTKFVNVVAPNIASVTVKWRDGTQPDIYTSTTLEQIKAYLKVEATLTDGKPFGDEILAGAYRLVGSWTGDETKPSKGGTYSLQVYLKDFPTVPPATLENVVYQDVKLTGITYAVKDGQTLTTEYKGLDKFDTSKITVYASYNDGREPVEINLSTGRSGYIVVYADGHDCLWVGDENITLSYTEGTETKICKIENLSVEKKAFDTSGITFNDRTVTYTGKDFTLTASGFSLGSVSYTYIKKGEPDETLAVAKATTAGTYEVTAKFTFTEQIYSVNYEAVEDITKTLTIEKAKYEEEIVLPTVSVDYDNGKPLGDSVKVKNLPLGVTVTYTYKDEDGNAVAKDQIKNAGNYTVTVSFGVDEENFEPLAPITATFTINKLDPKVSPTVGGSLVSGTTLSDLALTGGKNEISGTFAWEDASQTLKEGRNICWYTFTPDDTTNYNQVRSYFEWDVAGEAKEGLSAGALAGIAIAAVIAVIIISIVALVVALKARKNSDEDGFYDDVTEADLANY
ncbi:MAG: hypothetical protein K2O28_06810 [Clostridia bacterium]|nr:hypothetical protein [Clostridia bacterium]